MTDEVFMSEWRIRWGIAVISGTAGLLLGAFLWGRSPRQVSTTETTSLQVEKTVQSEARLVVTVTVERTVFVNRALTAERVIEDRHTAADGTISIRTEMFGLGLRDTSLEVYRSGSGMEMVSKETESSKASLQTTKQTVVQNHRPWSVGVWSHVRWDTIATWDYRTDWIGSVQYRPAGMPVWLSVGAGPSVGMVGLGLDF